MRIDDRVRDLAKNRTVRATVGLAAAAAAGAVAGSRYSRKANGHHAHEPVIDEPRLDEPHVEGYCVKERKKVAIQSPVQTTMKNGKPAIRGVCPDCGTKIFRIGTLPA